MLEFHLGHHIDPAKFGSPLYKRSWTYSELIGIFPEESLRILDIGSGDQCFRARLGDELVSVDFNPRSKPRYCMDFTKDWPFEMEQFCFVYASHVIEHLYPDARDRLICNIYDSMRKGALLFVRVPHWNSIQGTGWEHYTFYGTNGLTGLTHGRNPYLPMFDMLSTGVFMADTRRFFERRTLIHRLSESVLNSSFRLTDTMLCYLVGGIPEVQFLLRRPE